MKSSKIKKVYVAEYNGNYKIGVSNNVFARLGQLSCGCPTIKSIYESDFLSNAFEIESLLHNLFKEKNVGGEWFSNVDICEIRNIIEQMGRVVDYQKNKREEMKRFSDVIREYFNEFYSMPKSSKKLEIEDMNIEELRFENEQIEKFIQTIQGLDISNIYSDLIYKTLFDKNTKELIMEYKPHKFESFRAKLDKVQNDKIENLEMLVSSLINCGWGYSEIKEFITNQSQKLIAVE